MCFLTLLFFRFEAAASNDASTRADRRESFALSFVTNDEGSGACCYRKVICFLETTTPAILVPGEIYADNHRTSDVSADTSVRREKGFCSSERTR